MKIKKSKYTNRLIARVVIEATTPIAVGSGDKDIITDALVATDVNGLPYIPGTSIAGVLRSMIGKEQADTFFGNQDQGSEIIFSEAKIMNSCGKVIDGLDPSAINDELLQHYRSLPIRQHVRIGHKGVTETHGKFDEQVVFAGTRFCFEIEMVDNAEKEELFYNTLNCLNNKTFRLGHGSRKGFGSVAVREIKILTFDLRKEEDRRNYLQLSSNLNDAMWDKVSDSTLKDSFSDITVYHITLQPRDFMFFGSGLGDQDADMTPVKEHKVEWNGNYGQMKENLMLIPASSIKGAIAHRVAYYWNKKKGYFAGNPEAKVGDENPAVQKLFGCKLDKGKIIERGNVLFSDIINNQTSQDVVLNHVAIDRFTGGAIDGALFQEKPTFAQECSFETDIIVYSKSLEDAIVKESFECALLDIVESRLPLGGGVNRGNGIFTGTITKNGEPLHESR